MAGPLPALLFHLTSPHPTHPRSLQALVREIPGLPIPFPALHEPVAPLMVHHLETAGIPAAAVFRGLPGIPSAEDLMRFYWRRKRALARAAGGLDTTPFFLKGAALEAHYAAPALRTMADLDILVDEAALPALAANLRRTGWRPSGDLAGVWINPARDQLDIHVPSTPFSRRFLERSRLWNPTGGEPHPGFHLVFLAIHCGLHHGEKIWRDTGDARALLGRAQAHGRLELQEALHLALEEGWEDYLGAFFRFLDRAPAVGMPAEARALARQASWRARRLEAAYRQLAFETASAAAMHGLRRLRRSPWEWLASGGRMLGWPGNADTAAAAPSAGPMPGHLAGMSLTQRGVFILKDLCAIARRGQLARYWHLAALQKEALKRSSPFRHPEFRS